MFWSDIFEKKSIFYQVHKLDSNVQNMDWKNFGYNAYDMGDYLNYLKDFRLILTLLLTLTHFRPYLYGRAFLVKTDHNPLVYLNNTKNKSSRVCRWRLQLSEYKYEIEFKKGVLNTNADALSRVGEVMEG